MLEHAFLRIAVAEAHIVEGDGRALARAAQLGVAGLVGGRVADGGLCFQHLVHALGRHVGARQHDGDHADHEEAHDDDHRVGDERDEVARLDGAVVDVAAAHPYDEHRHAVHDEHHQGHHERHDAVREQLRLHELGGSLVEALLLVGLAVERADDGQAREDLARHEVHAVDEGLHDLELGQRHAHQHHDEHEDDRHGQDDDPAHGEVRARNHDDAADGEDGRVQHHAQQHDGDHLHQLDVVRAARDERGGRETLHLGVRERHHAAEQLRAQRGAHLRGRARGDEAHEHGGDHAEGGKPQHQKADAHEVAHLHVGQIVAERLVLSLGGGDGLLVDDGVAHVPHMLLGLVQHIEDLLLVDSAGLVGLHHLVEVEVGDLAGIMDGNQRQGHHAVELLLLLLALVVELVRAVVRLGVSVAERLLVVDRKHHGDLVMGLGRHLVGGRMLHAGLLDAHIDDIGRVVRQRQVGERLHDEQAHDEQHGHLAVLQIANYAHGASSPSARLLHVASGSSSWNSTTLRRMRTRCRMSSIPTCSMTASMCSSRKRLPSAAKRSPSSVRLTDTAR